VATQRGRAKRPQHRHPPCAQPVVPLRFVSRWVSTADPEAWHRSGTTLQAGTPRWPHTGGETA